MRSANARDKLLSILPVLVGFFGLMALGALFPRFARVLDLALPFFGLIGLGYICGRIFDFGEEGLAWVNVFIVYVALPSMFFVLISKTPVHELLNFRFVACTAGATVTAFSIAFAVGMKASGGNIPEATIQANAGGYANIVEATRAMTRLRDECYTPQPQAKAVYDRLYAEYIILHDYFGRGGNDVMKRMKALKAEVLAGKD